MPTHNFWYYPEHMAERTGLDSYQYADLPEYDPSSDKSSKVEDALFYAVVAPLYVAETVEAGIRKSEPFINDTKETVALIGTLGLVTALRAGFAIQEYIAPVAKKMIHGVAETGMVATAIAVHGTLEIYDIASPTVKKGAQRLSALAQKVSDKIAPNQYVQF